MRDCCCTPLVSVVARGCTLDSPVLLFVVAVAVPYLARCIFELFVEIRRQQTGRGYLWCHSSVCVKISRDKIFETCHTNKSKVSSPPSSPPPPPPPSFRQVIDLALKALWLEMLINISN